MGVRCCILSLCTLVLVASACSSEALPLDTPPPCVCSVEAGGAGCTGDACTFALALEESCIDQVPFAEVLIDGHLEAANLVHGEVLTPCSRTEPGAVSVITVRGGLWVWGPREETCAEPGQQLDLTFACETE